MQGLLGGFLSPEAGQARRAWLNEQDQRIDGVLSYFLGPQLMPRVRGAVGAANELTDFADYRDAVLGADQMATGSTTADRIAGAGAMATGLAAMMVPGVSARMAEGATDVAGDLARFIADEDGGIRVWHGSPHDFDKFSMDAIGTGEGAQAYGHGLYFAESEGVARSYRDALSRVTKVNGQDLDELAAEARSVAPPLGDWGTYDLRKIRPGQVSDESLIAAYIGDYVDPQRAIMHLGEDDHLSAADLAQKWLKEGRLKERGSLYEVDLHANPEDFLDWDAPLSAQPEIVRDAFAGVAEDYEQLGDTSLIGANPNRIQYAPDVSPSVYLKRGNAEAALEKELKARGIPGIRYLDQGSRGAGDGTRNYVVFDENIIEIVKKYGIAGAAAMLGLSAAEVEAQVAQQGSGGGW